MPPYKDGRAARGVHSQRILFAQDRVSRSSEQKKNVRMMICQNEDVALSRAKSAARCQASFLRRGWWASQSITARRINPARVKPCLLAAVTPYASAAIATAREICELVTHGASLRISLISFNTSSNCVHCCDSWISQLWPHR
jgi:hypothetical protein